MGRGIVRALVILVALCMLVACVEQRVPPRQGSEIRSLVLVIEPFDEIKVTTHWMDLQRARQVYNPQTKRMETELGAREVRQSGTTSIRTDLDLRGDIRAALNRALSGRYKVDASDRRVPAIQEAFNPIGIALKGRAELVADAVEEAIPASSADAILVIRGPVGSIDYDYGYTPNRRDTWAAGRVQADYDYFLVDGTGLGVIAAIGPSFIADRRSPVASPPRNPAARFLAKPHAYRIAAREYDDENLAAFRDTLRQVIETDIPQQLRYLGLLPDNTGS
jgi:hypothetical protein